MTTRHTRLVLALRELRTRTGLSLAALAERTAYSKSSWERYLNGKGLPPRQAVRELCRVADEPDGRLLALWEIAESDWRGRAAVFAPAAEEPRPEPEPEPEPGSRPQPPPRPQEAPPPSGTGRPRGRRGRLMVVLASVYTLLAGGVALAFLLLPGRDMVEEEALPASLPYALGPQCHGAACEGRDPLRLICGIHPGTLTTYRTATGAHMELRHSEKCGASWARVWGTRIGDRVEVTAGGPAHHVRIENKDDTETYVYTGMTETRPGSTVRACFRPASADGERKADGEKECVEARVGESATTRPPPP